jgi:hypothetical protein
VIPREERHRLATLVAGVPLVALAIPVFAPRANRSLFEEIAREPVALAILLVLLASLFLTAGASLVAGIRRKAPGGAVHAVPTAIHTLLAAGFVLLVLFAPRGAREEQPLLGASALVCAAAFYLLVRGFRRGGFERWAQLVAGTWLVGGCLALLVSAASSSRLRLSVQTTDQWLVVFALAFSLPALGWALWPRRGEEVLRRGGGA